MVFVACALFAGQDEAQAGRGSAACESLSEHDQRAARENARRGLEALNRAIRVHNAWMARRDPGTGLLPQSSRVLEFRYQNVAADFLCFEYAIAERCELASVEKLRETFRRERALCLGSTGGTPASLVRKFDVRTGAVLGISERDRMFATSEYLKDGLVGLYERTGEEWVRVRIVELARAIERACATKSDFGLIPSTNSEINGNVLQVFSRCAGVLGGERAGEGGELGELAGRLADAIVMQMLPACGGVPVLAFDYSGTLTAEEIAAMARSDRPSMVLHLRDHGNETAVGLSEAYALAVSRREDERWARRVERWTEPLARMYETILEKGVNARGLLATRVRADTMEMLDVRPSDTWGYVLVGAITFVDAARLHGGLAEARLNAILERVDQIALAVTKTDGLVWQTYTEPGERFGHPHHDGWADTIESAIYIAHRRPALRERLLNWCDGQITFMFALQGEDGYVSGDYLDGNFIRTAMLYAEAKSGGARLEPWSGDASLGYAESESGGVFVVVAGKEGYEGKVVFDTARHRENLKMPWDWARLNAWPEWVTGRASVSVKVGAGQEWRVPN